MSVRTMASVWDDSTHSGTELLMLLAIADFADDDGKAYPSIATLARKCRMTPRNVNHILPRLTSSGELSIKLGHGPNRTNLYRVTLVNGGKVKATSPLKSSSPLKPPSRDPEAAFLQTLKPPSDKPPLNHHEPPLLCVDASDSFESFWSAYPRKVNKPAARRAFAKLKPEADQLAQMLAAIEKQRKSEQWSKDAGRFIPHPATWLNGERWLDDAAGECQTATGSTIDTMSAPTPRWATAAGFKNRFEAENAGCTERNHKQFANGKKVVAK